MTAADVSGPGAAIRGNVVIGVVSIAVGAAVIPYGASMPYIREGIPGPGLFPMMVGGLLVLFGVLLILTSVLAGRRERRHLEELSAVRGGGASSAVPEEASASVPLTAEDSEEITTAAVLDTDIGSDGARRWINGAVLMGGIMVYVLFAEILGFPLTMMIVVTAIVWSLRAKWWVALLTGVVTSLVLWAMFEQGLMVQLPDGLIRGF